MSKQNSTGMFIGGLMIGSAVGTVLGLLVAPRTGKETRKVIKKSADALPEIAEDLTTSFQLQADRLSESTLENWETTLNRLRQAIAAGIEASRETSQATKLKTAQQDLNSSITAREAYPKGNRF
jgi:gas vesicle protein